MTTRAVVIHTVDLKPNPPAYGELRLRKGVWDQLQARKAYVEVSQDDLATERPAILDRQI